MQVVVKLAITACVLALVFASGCRYDGLARDQMEMRDRHINEVIGAIVISETSCPSRMANTADRVAQDVAIDVNRVSRNSVAARDYLIHEGERWRSSSVARVEDIERVLRGRPDSIPRSALILFY